MNKIKKNTMTYDEAIKFIYEKLPMYHKIGSEAYKPGLQNIANICKVLGNPQNTFKSIHVAGTNGKGSTSHLMAAMLQTAGYKTGLFTSPHLKNFTERIKIDGTEVGKAFVADFISKTQIVIESIQPSFFEITTAMAFAYFAEKKIDWAVIEVGLGGRLDSTNIISPQLAIITNISYDHQDLLGNTLALIASEKAGIIKPNTPVIICEDQKNIGQVFIEKARQENAPIYYTNDIEIINKGIELGIRKVDIKVNDDIKFTNVKCGLQGNYQLKNIKGVVKAWQLLNIQGLKISNEHLTKALLEVKELTGLKGRWQILKNDPLVICDTGHNEAGMQEIVEQLKTTTYKKLIIVLGMVKDKQHDHILSHLPQEAYYIFTQPTIERAISAQQLALKAEKYQLKGEVIFPVPKAIEKALQLANKEDLIFIGGSTFVVAEIENL